MSQGLNITLSDVNSYIDADLVHSIHTTTRRSFRGCRRRWSWIFQDGYYPLVTPKPLEFGIAYHRAMETMYDPDTWNIDRDVAYNLARKVFKDECVRQLNEYRTKFEVDAEVEQDYKERVELGLGMLQEYYKVSRQLDSNLRPVFTEKKFEVPITGPTGEIIWCKCNRCWRRYSEWTESLPDEVDQYGNVKPHRFRIKDASSARAMWQGLPVTYGGRIDLLVEDLNGQYWILDWKTAARLSTGEPGAPDDYLFLDDQISSYCWALRKILNIDIAGFIYHEQKKAFPVEPEPLLRPRMGRMFSTNKQLDCDWETYERTVRDNDFAAYSAGLYDEFIQYLQDFGGVFHKRHQIYRTPEELEEVGRNIYLEALDMTDPNLRLYPSAGRFACAYCAFQEPCRGKNRGDDYQYTLETMFEKREKHYFQEPSTDKPDRG